MTAKHLALKSVRTRCFAARIVWAVAALGALATAVAAKGWLHGNCAHCHNKGFKYDARHSLIESTTVNIPQNDPIIVPGDAEASGLFISAFRWDTSPKWKNMPEIAVSAPDPQAEQPVQSWINSL